jgi:hypothetical protein
MISTGGRKKPCQRKGGANEMAKYNDETGEVFRVTFEARNFKMVGLNADWNLRAYLIKENKTHDFLAFDDEEGGFFLARVNKTTVNGDARGFTNGNEEWYDDENNYTKLISDEDPDKVLAFIDALLFAEAEIESRAKVEKMTEAEAEVSKIDFFSYLTESGDLPETARFWVANGAVASKADIDSKIEEAQDIEAQMVREAR